MIMWERCERSETSGGTLHLAECDEHFSLAGGAGHGDLTLRSGEVVTTPPWIEAIDNSDVVSFFDCDGRRSTITIYPCEIHEMPIQPMMYHSWIQVLEVRAKAERQCVGSRRPVFEVHAVGNDCHQSPQLQSYAFDLSCCDGRDDTPAPKTKLNGEDHGCILHPLLLEDDVTAARDFGVIDALRVGGSVPGTDVHPSSDRDPPKVQNSNDHSVIMAGNDRTS
ncbi:hypothetical protein GE09DRAFT_1087114 [Coniochaeta sp. 2T2.1]|nr:hypothetical protein GE09DRAFT_1087114 [Coniochaeta sp. 2T2.1]